MLKQHKLDAGAVVGTLDGLGAGDHDQPYRFGRKPRSGTSYPFSTRQYIRLLILRGRIQDGEVSDGQIGGGAMNAMLLPIAQAAAGQPGTFRPARSVSEERAYRGLVIAMLGLDIETLASDLRATRLGKRRRAQRAADLARTVWGVTTGFSDADVGDENRTGTGLNSSGS